MKPEPLNIKSKERLRTRSPSNCEARAQFPDQLKPQTVVLGQICVMMPSTLLNVNKFRCFNIVEWNLKAILHACYVALQPTTCS